MRSWVTNRIEGNPHFALGQRWLFREPSWKPTSDQCCLCSSHLPPQLWALVEQARDMARATRYSGLCGSMPPSTMLSISWGSVCVWKQLRMCLAATSRPGKKHVQSLCAEKRRLKPSNKLWQSRLSRRAQSVENKIQRGRCGAWLAPSSVHAPLCTSHAPHGKAPAPQPVS